MRETLDHAVEELAALRKEFETWITRAHELRSFAMEQKLISSDAFFDTYPERSRSVMTEPFKQLVDERISSEALASDTFERMRANGVTSAELKDQTNKLKATIKSVVEMICNDRVVRAQMSEMPGWGQILTDLESYE